MTESELIYVKTIAEEKSITQAANKLFLTQPSLSKCIKKIESSLGTKLFKRTSTGLILTYAGEKYYQFAVEILKKYDDFKIEITDINNLKKGLVRIGITRFLATYLLPIILPKFKQRCPNIDINIFEDNSTELEKALSYGKLDFAIMHTIPGQEESNHQNIDFYPLSKDPFLLAISKNHNLSTYSVKVEGLKYPKIDLTLFADEPFIMISLNQRIRQVTDMIMKIADIKPHVILTTKNYETARRLTCEGIGITFVPELYSQIFISNKQPNYYYIDDKYSPYWTTCVAIQRNAYVSKAANLFIKMTSKELNSTDLEI